MSRRVEMFELLANESIVGVVREESSSAAWNCALAYFDHGLRFIEITLTTPDALSLIERLAAHTAGSGIVIAAGTVRSGNDAADARRAGAAMLVSPHTNLRMIEYANEHDLLCVAGAATPSEIVHAWESGADIVKVYPAPQLGGADYIRTIRGPLPDIAMLAGGPVTLDQIDNYLDAGAVAVNLGGSLALPQLVAEKNWDEIGRRVRQAVRVVAARHGVSNDEHLSVH